jgi:FKBP-type peptidyl-prolyl cis-trans isomerase 2
MQRGSNKDIGAIGLASILIMIVVVASASYGVYSWYSSTQEKESIPFLIVEDGDMISVDYIGFFEDDRVFDTSIEDVAKNDAAYPKSLSFQLRSEGGYKPLEFTVGTGQMIKGFDEGAVGMWINQTKEITIPPEEGYGASDPNKIEIASLIEEVPIKVIMNKTVFLDTFGAEAKIEISLKDPTWRWNITVFDVSDENVTYYNEPEMNMIINPQSAWDSKVIQIDSSANGGDGLIIVKHLLDDKDANKIIAHDQGGQFIVINVDVEAGTFTKDYNREVVGKTLIFRVTIRTITKP